MTRGVPDLPDDDHLPLLLLYTRACVHALNNHLSGASGFQQLLAMKLEQAEFPEKGKLLEYLREMDTCLLAMEKILRDLSSWAKPTPPQLKPLSLPQQAARFLDAFCVHRPEARIERDLPESLPPVLADEGLLQNLMQAVLENAVRATSENQGTIRVSIQRSGGNGGKEAGSQQFVRFEDRGCGIDPARMPYLQLPVLAAFQTLGQPVAGWLGSGFGLPMAFSYARQMKGKLSVESHAGEGTTVTLRLSEADQAEEGPAVLR
jgi:two-component system sensor histidine kinase KdpD